MVIMMAMALVGVMGASLRTGGGSVLQVGDPPVKAVRAAILHYVADAFNAPAGTSYEYFEDGLLVLKLDASKEGYVIESVGPYDALSARFPGVPVSDERPALLMPGFLDLHIHAPQPPLIASYGGSLFEWLTEYTFPTEAEFRDETFARNALRQFLGAMLEAGTTTAIAFTTAIDSTTDLLFEEAAKLNMRIIAGVNEQSRDRVGQETPTDPAPFLSNYGLLLSPEAWYNQTLAGIAKWHGKGRALYGATGRLALKRALHCAMFKRRCQEGPRRGMRLNFFSLQWMHLRQNDTQMQRSGVGHERR